MTLLQYAILLSSSPGLIAIISKYSDDWVCVGYGYGEEVYLCVWRLEGDDYLEIPKVKNVSIIYPEENKCEITETIMGINVRLDDKYSAVVLKGYKGEINYGNLKI